jgi:hypothetical protein
MERCSLDNGANGHEHSSNVETLSSTKLLANEEDVDGSDKAANSVKQKAN